MHVWRGVSAARGTALRDDPQDRDTPPVCRVVRHTRRHGPGEIPYHPDRHLFLTGGRMGLLGERKFVDMILEAEINQELTNLCHIEEHVTIFY